MVFLKYILSVAGIYTLSSACSKFQIPLLVLKKELKNFKSFFLFNRYFFHKKNLLLLQKKLNNNYVHNIKVDDFKFKLTFLNYKLDKGISQRIEGIREPSTVSAIRSLVKKGNKVLELGACYGYFSSIMSLCAGKKGKIVSIEGLPNNYKILKTNIKLNKFKNIFAYNYFLSNNPSSKFIYFNKSSHNPYSGIKNYLSYKKNSSNMKENDCVNVIRLSDFLKKIKFYPDNIFMDIEGFEVDVLEDLFKNYFKKKKNPIIVFEIHREIYKKKRNLNYIKSILKSKYDYREDSGNLICLPNNC
ncbi:fkbM_fam, methyltransferase, FkbM family [Candidatus Pelagibacterales bacterium]